MEITTKQINDVELITVRGRVDSVEAHRFEQTLQSAIHHGRYKIVVDMTGLEYMSSPGFRALGDAQRNARRHPPGQVILAQVPAQILEALELVGFTEHFHISGTVSDALVYAANPSMGDTTTGAQIVGQEPV